jgi:serine/threonine-protein kinase RsbT
MSEIVRIRCTSDVIYAQIRSRLSAGSLGFGVKEQWEISVSVSEAATNILKFAGSGEICFTGIEGDRPGLEFQARDGGPGISDPELAVKDDYSEGRLLDENVIRYKLRGMGSGLPAIQRLMDELLIACPPEGGTLLTARKYLRMEVML